MGEIVISLCSKTGKECRGEYFETVAGEEWERCLDCGELRFVRFHDVGSGG
jgi:hypothetical protein